MRVRVRTDPGLWRYGFALYVTVSLVCLITCTVLEPDQEVNTVAEALAACVRTHPCLATATVAIFAEANLDQTHSNALCRGLTHEIDMLLRMPVFVFSDDKAKQNKRPGFILTHARKRVAIDKLRQFMRLKSVAFAAPFVGTRADLDELKRQMIAYEYEPVVEKSTGNITGYTYSGKRSGCDDRATILFECEFRVACMLTVFAPALSLFTIFMNTHAPPNWRRVYRGNFNALARL